MIIISSVFSIDAIVIVELLPNGRFAKRLYRTYIPNISKKNMIHKLCKILSNYEIFYNYFYFYIEVI